MKNEARLFLFCGKMGAGKSTQSIKVANQYHAVRISEDEWLSAHYPTAIRTFDDYIKHSTLIKPFVKQHMQQLLSLGVNVVMDFPANTVKQRAWLIELSKEAGCNHQLYYLDISDTQCLAQLKQRQIEQPDRASFDTEAVFTQVTQYFEPPTEAEELNIKLVHHQTHAKR